MKPLPAKFIAYIKGGRTKEIADYEESDDGYMFHLLTGGYSKYPKFIVEKIEPIRAIGS